MACFALSTSNKQGLGGYFRTHVTPSNILRTEELLICGVHSVHSVTHSNRRAKVCKHKSRRRRQNRTKPPFLRSRLRMRRSVTLVISSRSWNNPSPACCRLRRSCGQVNIRQSLSSLRWWKVEGEQKNKQGGAAGGGVSHHQPQQQDPGNSRQ